MKTTTLMTVFAHFQTETAYYAAVESKKAALQAEWDARYPGIQHPIWDDYRTPVWRPPHRYNNMAAFIAVDYDGGSTIKSYCYRASKPGREPKIERAPRRNMTHRWYTWFGKISEAWLPSNPTRADFENALRKTELQLKKWARQHRWSLQFDQPNRCVTAMGAVSGRSRLALFRVYSAASMMPRERAVSSVNRVTISV